MRPLALLATASALALFGCDKPDAEQKEAYVYGTLKSAITAAGGNL